MSGIVSHPGYYLIALDAEGEPDYDINGEPVIDGSLVQLPKSPRISMKYGQITYKKRMVSERRRRWNYTEASLDFYEMTFRVNKDTELPYYRALHDAVGGDGDPFIFVFDTTESPLRTLFVFKESNFEVSQVQRIKNGNYVDYTMRIEEVPTGPAITD